jgi:hypothetical protein
MVGVLGVKLRKKEKNLVGKEKNRTFARYFENERFFIF